MKSRQNRPLLLEVANRLGVTPRVRLDLPPIKPRPGEPGPGDVITLDRLFDLKAFGVKTADGEYVTMTRRELVRAWAEQLGGVHEDWAVDEALVAGVKFPLIVGGVQALESELYSDARTVLEHGTRIVAIAKSKLA